jgi:phosphate/sulfate permease
MRALDDIVVATQVVCLLLDGFWTGVTWKVSLPMSSTVLLICVQRTRTEARGGTHSA